MDTLAALIGYFIGVSLSFLVFVFFLRIILFRLFKINERKAVNIASLVVTILFAVGAIIAKDYVALIFSPMAGAISWRLLLWNIKEY